MVKGNWERRAELAALRREEEKARKLEKKSKGGCLKVVSAESVVSRMKREGVDAQCWLAAVDEASAVSVCRAFFRTGFCSAKRCRLVHVPSPIAHLKGVCFRDEGGGGAEADEELACDSSPVALSDLSTKDYKRLSFVALGGVCVFDYADTTAWERYSASLVVSCAVAVDPRAPIAEGEDEDGDEEVGEEDDETSRDQRPPPFECMIVSKQGVALGLLSCVLSFLSVRDVFGSFVFVCHKVRKGVLSDALVRLRKRAAFGDVSSLLSKKSKAQKKKRNKQAYIGAQDKVDAYARGIAR